MLFGALVLLALSVFVFFLFFVAPGDPARMVAGDKATETQLIQIRKNLGLDRPIHEQYLSFLGKALQGDLGFSYRNQQPVAKLIFNRLPATLSLVIGGVLVWLAVGIPIGIMSARHPGGLRDRLGQGFILVGLSFPDLRARHDVALFVLFPAAAVRFHAVSGRRLQAVPAQPG